MWLIPVSFPIRLIQLRKHQGHTQQSLADTIELHVNQIKRYESGTAQRTLDTLTRLAKAVLESLILKHDANRFSAAG